MNNQDNKTKILNIALELFSKKGYDAVGVQLLCEKTGITKPTLYYYFSNKEGVLKELLKVNYDKLNNLLELNSHYIPHPKQYEHDVILTLTNVAQTYLEFAKNNEKFYKMVLNATNFVVSIGNSSSKLNCIIWCGNLYVATPVLFWS